MHAHTLNLRLQALLLLCLSFLASCGSFEEKRIRQLLHEKGFGARAEGEATIENYVGGLDSVQFLLSPSAVQTEGAERLVELSVVQPIGIDGTIFVPYVGPVYVLGLTELELAAQVQSQLKLYFKPDFQLQARIIQSNKLFYAVGEVLNKKGRQRLEPDMTFLDAMFTVGWTELANLGRVYLIRPDAENPLVIDINFREMLTTGHTTANLRMHERDILYVPPTFLGLIARMLERLLQPVAVAVQTMLGVARIRTSYDIATGQQQSIYFRF
jgi:protein involved in polysaccharide export with SLBB domain